MHTLRTMRCGWNRCGWLLAALPLPAQELQWRLPPFGAVEYRREWKASASEVARTQAAAKALPAVGKVPDRYLHRLAPAPWLCQGELRPDQRAIGDPVRDLRDVLRALAFDLANRGSVRTRFARVVPFGDVTVTGSWSVLGPDGSQTLRASLSARPPAAIAGELAGTIERLRPFCLRDADGSVALERRIDAQKGLVPAWKASLDLVVDEGDKTCRRFVLSDRWDLVAVHENQDADFRERVVAGIAAGTAFVREAIDEKKSFLVDSGGDERNYGSGRLALGLLTMVHGLCPASDPVLVRGFDELRRRKIEDSYSLAAALMAMAQRYAPPGEAERIRAGLLAAPVPRKLDERDHKVAQKWVKQLLENIDPRTDPTQVLRFNYTAGPRYDTSLQQYGLLGLWSAQTCGVELPPGVFAAAARQLLAVQGPANGRLGLRLATYAQLREVAGTDQLPGGPAQNARVRGFAYERPTEPPFGSMTSAGISGLLLARAGMSAQGGADRALESQIDDAVRDGFAWLASEFTVRANPGFAERADHHWYYWLYGLERSCELATIARLHDRDWYYEGGLQLLSQQQGNGSFRAEHPSALLLDATCFAVLFLAKSTVVAPVTGTGR
ncbi:MAG TPA: hypothetical protein VFT55_14285 [Planctomycetota bacterium]|nr:hypothetical protein [Planctomycetota bacterium]